MFVIAASVSVAALVWTGATPVNADPTPGQQAIPIHGVWTGRSPGPNGEIETGQNFASGVLNGTFQTIVSDQEPISLNGSYILHHHDVITSTTFKHNSGTARVPDTIDTDLTVTVVVDDGQYRSTFIGKFSNGTGIFEGAEGYYTGDGTTVTPLRRGADPDVLYFAGTIGGEIRLARPVR